MATIATRYAAAASKFDFKRSGRLNPNGNSFFWAKAGEQFAHFRSIAARNGEEKKLPTSCGKRLIWNFLLIRLYAGVNLKFWFGNVMS